MRKLRFGCCKLLLAALQLCGASLAALGMGYSLMNMAFLLSATPCSAVLPLGGTVAAMSYLALCFLSAARDSAVEGMAEFDRRNP